ncbi:MAG: 16S rRNA (uracil(1498)-N(3))-methyltransferase [Planctomycetota bacterium]|nr:MAG: 16S rRNA (uracil(1498)-N(3))-methyltransferase [Planctomycetota bacterium]
MPEDGQPAHRIYFSDLAAFDGPGPLSVDGPEAHHAANAKRLRVGEPVQLFDGRGTTASAIVTGVRTGKRAALDLDAGPTTRVPAVSPRVEVWCPPPKGDRLETMIDQLSQLGVAAWRPLRTARAERDTFRSDKLRRVAVESAKQCGRAWLLEVGEWADFEQAILDDRVCIADTTGRPCPPATTDTVLLLGPEGGWTSEEIDQARATGRAVVRFGPHVMRIETAAVAGGAMLLCRTHTPP